MRDEILHAKSLSIGDKPVKTKKRCARTASDRARAFLPAFGGGGKREQKGKEKKEYSRIKW